MPSCSFSALDHIADDVDNVLSIVGGRLTTYRQMVEAASNRVYNRLAVAVSQRGDAGDSRDG